MTSNSPFKSKSHFFWMCSAGFTLIEILIVIFLLAVISLSIFQATTQTFRYRDTLIREGDFYNNIRLSMGIMDQDIAALFSPALMNPYSASSLAPSSTMNSLDGSKTQSTTDTTNDPVLLGLLSSELGQVTDFWLGATDKTGIRNSRFVGNEQSLRFVSASHQRMYKNFPESDFAKIQYLLEEDKSEEAVEKTSVLYKIEDPNVFDDLEKKGDTSKKYALLQGVRSFKFRFYNKEKQVWENNWDSSRPDFLGRFPDLIELSIEVVAPPRQDFQGTYIFKPEGPFHALDSTL